MQEPGTRAAYEDAVYRGAALTKRDVVALRAAQKARQVITLPDEDENILQAALRIAKQVRDKDEKISCLEKEVQQIDSVFLQAHERRKALKKKIEARDKMVQEEIDKVRQGVNQEAHHRHKKLRHIKSWFDQAVEQAHTEYVKEVDTRGDEVDQHVRKVDAQLDDLQQGLQEEIIAREQHISSGTNEMKAELAELEEKLEVEKTSRERAEQLIQELLHEKRQWALERMEVEAVDREKMLKKNHNEIQKQCKQLNSEETKEDQMAETVIDKIGEKIEKEEFVREACCEKLVSNLRTFLDEFERNIEEENAQKRKAIELMRQSMRDESSKAE